MKPIIKGETNQKLIEEQILLSSLSIQYFSIYIYDYRE